MKSKHMTSTEVGPLQTNMGHAQRGLVSHGVGTFLGRVSSGNGMRGGGVADYPLRVVVAGVSGRRKTYTVSPVVPLE